MDHEMPPEFCDQVRRIESGFRECGKLLTAVGDESRQHLLCVLMTCPVDGVRVAQIVDQTSLSRPAVSHHMQVLKDAGVVKSRKEGTRIFYYLDPDSRQMAALLDLVQRISNVMGHLPDRSEA